MIDLLLTMLLVIVAFIVIPYSLLQMIKWASRHKDEIPYAPRHRKE